MKQERLATNPLDRFSLFVHSLRSTNYCTPELLAGLFVILFSLSYMSGSCRLLDSVFVLGQNMKIHSKAVDYKPSSSLFQLHGVHVEHYIQCLLSRDNVVYERSCYGNKTRTICITQTHRNDFLRIFSNQPFVPIYGKTRELC
mmetsp:Transcript_14077/g.21384  ORF Transcript_14077/g.21384 Transcript_14077/m.21384 type:complete len:143 (-) Transcript_14077:396-824(-)